MTGFAGAEIIDGGTSFAVPHVVGTVALLQQYGDAQILTGTPEWSRTTASGPTSRRHEVMKAVLMNSADKLEDDGSFFPAGTLLGMERTVVKTDSSSTWLNSDAYPDHNDSQTGSQNIPLDKEMGTGHLNAKRALQQFLPGEHEPNGAPVPLIGWDYGTTPGFNQFNRYPLSQPLVAGDFISITLAWDRKVEFLNDAGVTDAYDRGDTFMPYTDTNPYADDVINDLDLFLVPAGETSGAAFLLSVSFEGTLEHLFAQVPTTGNYDILVEQFDDEAGPTQDYGLAWWYGLAPDIVAPGDFDGDGDVDADDLSGPNGWESRFGADLAGSDFLAWQRNFVGTAAPLAPPGGGSPSSLGKVNSPGTPTGGGTQSSFGQTIVISVEGDSPASLMVGQTGQLTILIDSDPAEVTFANGGLSLSIETSEPGFIEITDADVNNPQIFGGYVDRWTHAEVVGLATDEIDELFAFSLGSPALTDADPANMESDGRFLFATIDYMVVGEMPAGGFEIDVAASERFDPAVSEGADVLGQIVFIPLSMSGSAAAAVPEPTSAMLAVISSVGLAIGRRRRGLGDAARVADASVA